MQNLLNPKVNGDRIRLVAVVQNLMEEAAK
jgi:hypothetical protein